MPELLRAKWVFEGDCSACGTTLRDVDEAQSGMVATAKDLAAKGELMLSKSKGDDEIIY